jgi:5-methylcytosine-specific restriction endonuclease McrA
VKHDSTGMDDLWQAEQEFKAAESKLINALKTVLFRRYGAVCHYCGKECQLYLTDETTRGDLLSLDHKVPRSKGGQHSLDNVVLCCLSCNSRKGTQSYEQFRRLMRDNVRMLDASAQLDAPYYQAGRKVRHSVFGEGVITNATEVPKFGDTEVTVVFANKGTKKIMARLAKLEVLR